MCFFWIIKSKNLLFLSHSSYISSTQPSHSSILNIQASAFRLQAHACTFISPYLSASEGLVAIISRPFYFPVSGLSCAGFLHISHTLTDIRWAIKMFD